MKKEDLISLLNEIFIPLGFKRKGNNWVLNDDSISKVINLQKSNYSNAFYINYGYNLKFIPLNNEMMHVYNRLGSTDKEEQQRITYLLDLEAEIPRDQRLNGLKGFITDKIVSQILMIRTEDDVLIDLKKRPHLNNIPLAVKKYFNLPE